MVFVGSIQQYFKEAADPGSDTTQTGVTTIQGSAREFGSCFFPVPLPDSLLLILGKYPQLLERLILVLVIASCFTERLLTAILFT